MFFKLLENLCRCNLNMSNLMIEINGLSKQYRLAHVADRYITLRDKICDFIKQFLNTCFKKEKM